MRGLLLFISSCLECLIYRTDNLHQDVDNGHNGPMSRFSTS